MRRDLGLVSRGLMVSTSVAAVLAVGSPASAGGFAVREQSTQFEGTSYAGAAAGGALSSMFWNPAAAAYGTGLNTDSSYTYIMPRADLTVTSVQKTGNALVDGAYAAANPSAGDIGRSALVPASYGSYQWSKDIFIGVALNSGFGLTTKPENYTYQGAALGQTTKLFSTDLNPTIAYKIAPGITIGAGVQIEYEKGTLRFATRFPQDGTTSFQGEDVAFGGTAGILIEPMAGTTIGVGYRSQITHTLDGSLTTLGGVARQATADIKQPDMVTVSLRQAVAPNMRLLGTFEWTNWSRFDKIDVKATNNGAILVTLNTNWHDGYFLSGGGEYDYSPALTLRSGIAYEWSPIQNPSERIIQVPDSNRLWVSGGASYKWSEATTLNFAYSHVFVDNATFARTPAQGGPLITGAVDASVDIVSVGMKHQW